MTVTNKRYSYPRVTTIQIDVQPVRENPINMPHAFHARSVYGPWPYISHGPHRQSFASPHDDEISIPERNFGDQRQTGPVVVLGHLIPPPSWQSLSRGERFWLSGYTATSAYWVHIPACDRYVQCLLMGTNPSVLNWHRWGTTILEVSSFHILLLDLPNRQSPLFT
jgi:hypothetical protein